LVLDDSYRRVRIDNGAELAYIEQGTGAPLVYVHGAVSDVRYLQPELPVLAKRFRTIAYSRRYARPNKALDEDALDPIAQHVDDLASLLRALDAAPAHLAGISSGGTICLLLAVRHPELVRTLVLEDPAAFPVLVSIPPKPGEILPLLFTQPGTLWMALRTTASFGRMGLAMSRGKDEEMIRLLINWSNGFDAYSELTPDMKAQALANKAPWRAALKRPDPIGLTAADARRIHQPTLLISGERSPSPLRAVVKRLAELIPNSEVTVIHDASHGMNFQNPVALDAAILDFLERHSAA
jgi:pimeloyl-ACP methyl ester carboxylesterase